MRTKLSSPVTRHGLPYLRAFILTLALAGAFIFVAPIQAVLRRMNRQASGVIQRTFCRLICSIIGVKVAASGVPRDTEPKLIAANHVSWTDIIALASVYPLVFLAKEEVAHWPLLGALARLQGTIFVNRGDRQQISSVNAALADVLRDGETLVVFPEGTSTQGVMEPKFNSAHFRAAQLAERAILPAAILYTDKAGQADVGWYGDMTFIPHLWRLLRQDCLICHIAFGDPIDVREKDRKALASEAQEQVRQLLIKANDAHAERNGHLLRRESAPSR
jgi:1-acyl-sn-glycerol-3-phosphate acyltransferase